ncbi:uncharacterized protein LOC111829945 [Capsella rubella]|uniref:uncharacterized protein LOC111829945 n=1 Tax=Capsella rubella TaxID=81985 RepID=UPI000CD4C6B2|nr:uncharacterized protein LOC111829945 [Capsella rubella]
MDQVIVSIETRFEQFQSCLCRKKFFKVQDDKELSTFYDVTRKIEWIRYDVYHEKYG